MKFAVLALIAWAVVAYLHTGAARKVAPVSFQSPPSVEDCGCLVPPNHGLYR